MRILIPHRLGNNISEAIDGTIFNSPSFCKSNRPKCLEFYRTVKPNTTCICPFGFAVRHILLNNSSIYIIGLSIEGINSKKDFIKRIGKKETATRFSSIQYKALIEEIKEQARLEDSIKSIKNEAEEAKKFVEDRQKLLGDTMHEIRYINKQIKQSLEQLDNRIDAGDKYIDNIIKNLSGNSKLLSIRLDYYNYMVNPALLEEANKTDTPIYKKFDKIYKCLYANRTKKNLLVDLQNKSFGLYPATPMLEIGIFIIMENAFKYTPEDDTITVNFQENSRNKTLRVTIENWGPFIEQNELAQLRERGYRGIHVRQEKKYEGQGIGLYLLEHICKTNDIYIQMHTQGVKYIGDEKFSRFIVELQFSKLII